MLKVKKKKKKRFVSIGLNVFFVLAAEVIVKLNGYLFSNVRKLCLSLGGEV